MRTKRFHAALIVLIVPSLACGFSEYLNRSKAAEAHTNLSVICNLVASYVDDDHMVDGEVTSGVLPAAAARAPAHVPCGERTAWSGGPEWDEIGFNPADPLYYSYEYEPDADGNGFTVRAIGDLDCDQTLSTIELHATVTDGVTDCSGSQTATNEFE